MHYVAPVRAVVTLDPRTLRLLALAALLARPIRPRSGK
jgi:hypothetical protein